ncbi:MAG: MBOAT family O-acyltransferase [Acidobacteriota bacterium]|jgi:alginate O-acetyltransferase complex protein AlgI
MVFSSNLFLFGFLPLVLVLYFLIPARFRNIFLFICSLFFYLWGCGPVIFVFLGCVVLNHYSGRWIYKASQPRAKQILAACLVLDLSVLIYYKYFNFISNQAAAIFGCFNIHWQPGYHVALPIGVSFFVFKAMSYPIEIYRGLDTPPRKLSDFGTWLSLFPDFIAGPIVRFSEVSREILNRTTTVDMFFSGISRFAIGLAKKALIANHLGFVADKIFNLQPGGASAPLAWLGLVCYTFQIYYDFSGYSDMAIGLGRFFGFHFPENFNQPYRSQNITEFWRRWHMTLSRWFRDFLWFPLGANRKGKLRSYCNLFLVFLLCGAWHGAAWTFIVWGMYYGLLLVAELILKDRFKIRISGIPGNLYTMLAVMIGWVIFRNANLNSSLDFLRLLFGFHPKASAFMFFPLRYYLQNDVIFYLAAAVLFAWLPLERFEGHAFWRSAKGIAATGAASLLLIIYSAIVLSTAGFNPFIYFQF